MRQTECIEVLHKDCAMGCEAGQCLYTSQEIMHKSRVNETCFVTIRYNDIMERPHGPYWDN